MDEILLEEKLVFLGQIMSRLTAFSRHTRILFRSAGSTFVNLLYVKSFGHYELFFFFKFGRANCNILID